MVQVRSQDALARVFDHLIRDIFELLILFEVSFTVTSTRTIRSGRQGPNLWVPSAKEVHLVGLRKRVFSKVALFQWNIIPMEIRLTLTLTHLLKVLKTDFTNSPEDPRVGWSLSSRLFVWLSQGVCVWDYCFVLLLYWSFTLLSHQKSLRVSWAATKKILK